MKVRATLKHWNNTRLVKPGEVLEVPDGTKGTWFEVIEESKPEKVDPKKADPKKEQQ